MNQPPPRLPSTPPPIQHRDSNTAEQSWLIAAGVICVVFLLMLLLLFALRSPDKSGGQTSSSTANAPGASSSESAAEAEAGQDKPNATSLTAEKADSVGSQEQPEPQDTDPSNAEAAPSDADTAIETEDENLSTTHQLAKINNSLEHSSTGKQFFGINTTGQYIAFVIDRSSSMGSSARLKRAKAELFRAIKNLPATTKVSVVYFSTAAETKKDFIAFEPTKDLVERLENWSASIGPTGGTNPVPAIEIVLKYDCDQIFILSDGEFPPHTVKLIATKNSKRVPINTVALSGDPASLKQIATQNNGTYKTVKY